MQQFRHSHRQDFWDVFLGISMRSCPGLFFAGVSVFRNAFSLSSFFVFLLSFRPRASLPSECAFFPTARFPLSKIFKAQRSIVGEVEISQANRRSQQSIDGLRRWGIPRIYFQNILNHFKTFLPLSHLIPICVTCVHK